MERRKINTGKQPNDHTGDKVRVSMIKIDQNFKDLYVFAQEIELQFDDLSLRLEDLSNIVSGRNEIIKYRSINTIVVPISAPNTPTNITGKRTDWVSVIEKGFKLHDVDDPSGSVRYIGEETLDFMIFANISTDIQSSTRKKMTAYITVNGLFLPDSKSIVAESKKVTLYPQSIYTLKTNDVVGVAIENNDNNKDLEVILANIHIIKV